MAYLHGPAAASPAQPAVHDQAAADPLIVQTSRVEIAAGNPTARRPVALVVGGAVIGVLMVVALGIRLEDRRGGFPSRPRGWLARSARRATGAGTRSPELVAAQPSRRKDVLPV